MNADARHGGLRPKRCLAAELHSQITQLTQLKSTDPMGGDSSLVSPSHGATIVTATKSANSRLFTDCYPNTAAIAPAVNQTWLRFADSGAGAISLRIS